MRRSFEREIAALEEVFEFVDGFLDQEDVAPEHHFLVRFVIEELFTNVVRHAKDGKHPVEVELLRSTDRLTMAVRDFDVERYDPTARPEVDIEASLTDRQPGGLGVHLIRQLADGFDYSYVDRCSTVTVTKRVEDSHV